MAKIHNRKRRQLSYSKRQAYLRFSLGLFNSRIWQHLRRRLTIHSTACRPLTPPCFRKQTIRAQTSDDTPEPPILPTQLLRDPAKKKSKTDGVQRICCLPS